ncbi:MAG TPA: hypothetical protein VKU02_02660, partial [Gemmataceae bacterium]|nr:hypothetical protein [Gemmataceae bacterium]
QVLVEPAMVTVRGPQDTLERVRAIPTQPFALPLPDEATTDAKVVTADAVPLVQQLDGRRIRATPGAVAVRVVLQAQQRVYELTDVPVRFLCPVNFALRPLFSDERSGKIRLRLSGPAADESPAVVAYIDLGERQWQPGFYEAPLRLQLPEKFRLTEDPPRRLAFELAPLEAGAP